MRSSQEEVAAQGNVTCWLGGGAAEALDHTGCSPTVGRAPQEVHVAGSLRGLNTGKGSAAEETFKGQFSLICRIKSKTLRQSTRPFSALLL